MTQLDNSSFGVVDQRAATQHLSRQLDNLYGGVRDKKVLESAIARASCRYEVLSRSVNMFRGKPLDVLHSLQYATFVYLVGNEVWTDDPGSKVASMLFCLNKALHGIDIFPSVIMPEVFFISHGTGSVLGDTTYGNRLVIFQNVTVGRVADNRPTIGTDVILFPGCSITGKSVIGDRSVVSAGVHLHNMAIPADSVVSMSPTGVHIAARTRDYISLYIGAGG